MRVTKLFTAEEVEKLTAGGRSYIRTKDNVVVGLAITKQKNPEAPRIVVVGDGPGIIKNAKLLSCFPMSKMVSNCSGKKNMILPLNKQKIDNKIFCCFSIRLFSAIFSFKDEFYFYL